MPLVNALSSVGQEKEELLKGMEVMEITRLWFNSRLEQLALEAKQPTKKVKLLMPIFNLFNCSRLGKSWNRLKIKEQVDWDG